MSEGKDEQVDKLRLLSAVSLYMHSRSLNDYKYMHLIALAYRVGLAVGPTH